MYRRRLIAVAIALVLVVAATGVASAADDDKQSMGQPFGLVGTWEVTLMLPGAPPARVLATFNADGTTVESAAAPPATRGASHGVWERTGHDLYSVTRVFFRFNPTTGAFLGTTKVNATARVAPDRQTFAAVSISELRDPSGALILGGLRGTATAVRMALEEIPDQP